MWLLAQPLCMFSNGFPACAGLWVGVNAVLTTESNAVQRSQNVGAMLNADALRCPVVSGGPQASRDYSGSLTVVQE